MSRLANRRHFQSRALVNVNPTATLLAGPFDCTNHAEIMVEIYNPDAVQILDAWVEASTESTGPWYVLRDAGGWDGLANIAALACRNEVFVRTSMGPFLRVRGTASGVGITAAVVSFHTETP